MVRRLFHRLIKDEGVREEWGGGGGGGELHTHRIPANYAKSLITKVGDYFRL